MKVEVFVINLVREKKRRNYIQRTMKAKNINYSFFAATDGHSIDQVWLNNNVHPKLLEDFYSGKFPWLTKNQLACADSHRRLAAEILKSPHSYALVLEDDIFFERELDLETIALRMQDTDTKIAFLGFSLINPRDNLQITAPINDKYGMCAYPEFCTQGAYAYMLNSDGAQFIVDRQYPLIMGGADRWVEILKDQTRSACVVVPPAVNTGYFPSTIRSTGSFKRKIIYAILHVPGFKYLYKVWRSRIIR